jgi:hypothetical protein
VNTFQFALSELQTTEERSRFILTALMWSINKLSNEEREKVTVRIMISIMARENTFPCWWRTIYSHGKHQSVRRIPKLHSIQLQACQFSAERGSVWFTSIKLHTLSGTPILHGVNNRLQKNSVINRGNKTIFKFFCKGKTGMFNLAT